MSPRARSTGTPRPRRSHAERTAETRARVMAAVVESIAELGYPRTTSAEIARRAGVTWGAVQHHFGDKEGILMAVLEESFSQFAALLGEGPSPEESLEKRVSRFVDRAWEHFGGPKFRSTFEILLNLPGDLELAWQSEMLTAWRRTWALYFPESSGLSRRRTVELMHYTVAVLAGLASLKVIEGPAARVAPSELALLKDTLHRQMGGAG